MAQSLKGFRLSVRGIGVLAATAAALALLERRARPSVTALNQLGGMSEIWKWRGYEIFVTRTGSGPPVLLVHGIYAGASSFEYRRIFSLLGRTNRVIAFDMLGCGLSEMPSADYSADLFADQIVDAIRDLTEEPPILIGSSLGAAFAIRAAARPNVDVKALVTICPTGLGVLASRPSSIRQAIGRLLRKRFPGQALFAALSSPPSIRAFLRAQAYADAREITTEVVSHYCAVAKRPGARFVTAAFLGGTLNCDVTDDLERVDAPVLVVWGECASSINPVKNAAQYVRVAKRGTLVTVPDSGLLPQEEAPAVVTSAIEML